MKYLALVAALLLAGCNTGGGSSSICSPSPGQWCVDAGNTSVNNGSFSFPGIGGAVGYVYTGYQGNAYGKTITMTYTVSGSGTVLPSPASGAGNAEVRLFIWRRGDDKQCTNTTEWYRQWATWGTTGAGLLTPGQHTISMVISDPGWTDCLGQANAGQLQATAADLVGIGYTFGASAFGHGVFSNGQNYFHLDSFSVN